MFFDRYNLVKSVSYAKKESTIDIYKELLSVWYKLIDQESINRKIFNEFYYYGKISDAAISFYVTNSLK